MGDLRVRTDRRTCAGSWKGLDFGEGRIMPEERELTGTEKFATVAGLVGTAGCALWLIIPLLIFIVAMIAVAFGD